VRFPDCCNRSDLAEPKKAEAIMSFGQMPSCTCCGELLNGRFDRRSFMKAAGGAGLLVGFPFAGFAAEGNYEAMVLSCIDPRFPELTLNYMKGRGMHGIAPRWWNSANR
jgi:hypothetical protein